MSLGCPGCGSLITDLHDTNCPILARKSMKMETKDIGEPSKWIPVTDPGHLAALGKLLEEVNELGAILARTIIQGIDGVDPDTGEPNLSALAKEIADVRGLSRLNIDRFELDESDIAERAERKRQMKLKWIAMLEAP